MRWELKRMLLGIFLAVVSIWCLLFASGNAVLSWFSVFLLILAAGNFAGGYVGNQPGPRKPREKDLPDYPMENDDTDNNKKEQET